MYYHLYVLVRPQTGRKTRSIPNPMTTRNDIQRRISSVEATHQITSTMEMVARTKIKHAQQRVERSEPYAAAMRTLLRTLSEPNGEPVALATPHDSVKTAVLVVITSDRGLAGQFNNNILNLAQRVLKQYLANGCDVQIIACGKVASNYFTYRGFKPVLAFRNLSAEPRVEESETISGYLVDSYLSGAIDEVWAFYNHAKNAYTQIPALWKIMPIDMNMFYERQMAGNAQGIADDDPKLSGLQGYINYEPSREAVLNQLLPAYLNGYLYYMLINSAEGEQAARQVAMRNATENARELLKDLKTAYNRIRQDTITTELIEISSGTNALTQDEYY